MKKSVNLGISLYFKFWGISNLIIKIIQPDPQHGQKSSAKDCICCRR